MALYSPVDIIRIILMPVSLKTNCCLTFGTNNTKYFCCNKLFVVLKRETFPILQPHLFCPPGSPSRIQFISKVRQYAEYISR